VFDYEDSRAARLPLRYESPLGIQNIAPGGVRYSHVEILDSQVRHHHHHLGMCGHPALSLNATLPRTLGILFMVYDVYRWD
jgi:hypothetical protein